MSATFARRDFFFLVKPALRDRRHTGPEIVKYFTSNDEYLKRASNNLTNMALAAGF